MQATATNRILEYLQRQGEASAEDIQKALKIPRGTATSRTSTLVKRGELTVSGKMGRSRLFRCNKAPQVRTKNHFVFVCDHSGSMVGPRADAALRALNGQLKAVSNDKDNDNVVSVVEFDDRIETSIFRSKEALQHSSYWTRGGTALAGAVLHGIRLTQGTDPLESQVIVVLTDGGHNDDINGTASEMKEAIQLLTKEGRYTVSFICPKGDRITVERLGVPSGNIQECDWNDQRDLREIEVKTSGAAAQFLSTRSSSGGKVRSSVNYLAADLTRAPMQVSELREVTNEVRVLDLKKEQTIEDLLLEKVLKGGIFVPGTGFYELSKKERRLKADRKLLLMDRATGKVWADGKATVRSLCGYPEGTECAVQPGNHAGFVVFVQSKSSSAATIRARILPRGTKAIYWSNAI